MERADTAVTKLHISPLIVNGFKNGFHQWIQRILLVVVEAETNFFRNFFWFSKFGCTLEDLCLDMGTSVASVLTAETVFEIMKCISDVDMPARGGMGSKLANFQVFQFWVRPR